MVTPTKIGKNVAFAWPRHCIGSERGLIVRRRWRAACEERVERFPGRLCRGNPKRLHIACLPPMATLPPGIWTMLMVTTELGNVSV